MAAALLAGLFCIARGAVDLARRRYFWGALGITLGCAVLLLLPIQTHAVKLDLIRPQR